jgi:hypothetical protein
MATVEWMPRFKAGDKVYFKVPTTSNRYHAGAGEVLKWGIFHIDDTEAIVGEIIYFLKTGESQLIYVPESQVQKFWDHTTRENYRGAQGGLPYPTNTWEEDETDAF